MDSLTQIVLGAACGELVAGKKIGNKALVLGAIGGTIPDLDVFLGSWFFDLEIDSLAFHRGFMHSIWFAILAPFVLAWFSKKIGKQSFGLYYQLWFWSIFTHPILDCFTGYGTQFFTPISDWRVAWSNISVADPLYTLPFLIGIIGVSFCTRNSMIRKKWLKIGIAISSLYMIFTIGNKLYVNSVIKNSLAENNLQYIRYMTQPSILNNILWYSVAEADSVYYTATYSILDNAKIQWNVLPKSKAFESNYVTQKLEWFSDGYSYFEVKNGKAVHYYDLRYPPRKEGDISTSVFQFGIIDTNGTEDIEPFEPKVDDAKKELGLLWNRVLGKRN